jgi:hypothetical protein
MSNYIILKEHNLRFCLIIPLIHQNLDQLQHPCNINLFCKFTLELLKNQAPV